MFSGTISTSRWTAEQTTQFRAGILMAGVTLTVVAAALVGFWIVRARVAAPDPAGPPSETAETDDSMRREPPVSAV